MLGSYVVDVLPASLVAAAGMSLAFIPSLGVAPSSAAPQEGGLAAGIVNTSYQVGSGAALVAAVGSVLAAVTLRLPKPQPTAEENAAEAITI